MSANETLADSDSANTTEGTEDRVNTERRQMAFRMFLSGNIDIVADQVRYSMERGDAPEEVARELRKAEEGVRLLAEFAEMAALDQEQR